MMTRSSIPTALGSTATADGRVHLHHVNFGSMRGIPGSPNPVSLCHCLLIQEGNTVILIDTGLGTTEMEQPVEMFGQAILEGWGFEINPTNTAVFQLKERGLEPKDVTDIVLTHADVDHAGGLPDFPNATVHLSAEELANVEAKNARYLFNQFDHGPHWKPYADNNGEWFGLPSRKLALPLSADLYLIPLFGHTKGHCGVAIALGDGQWLLHAGDTYYRFAEVTEPVDPVEAVVLHSADDNTLRKASLTAVQRLRADHSDTVSFFSTHEMAEFGGDLGKRVLVVTTSHDRFDGPNPHPTGVWLEEFTVPYMALHNGGAALTVASPKGGAMPIDPRSAVAPEREAAWQPALWAAKKTAPLDSVRADQFDAIFLPGGHGPIFDLPENPELAALLTAFEAQGKLIGAVCHGPAGFLSATRARDGKPLVAGKTLTSYTWDEEIAAKLDQEVPFILEQRLREQGANFIAGAVRTDHIERDGLLLTGQNPWSSESIAQALLAALTE